MRTALALLAVLLAAPAAAETVRLGDLAIRYDPALWSVTTAAAPVRFELDLAPPADESLSFTCRAEACGGKGGIVWASAAPADGAAGRDCPPDERRNAGFMDLMPQPPGSRVAVWASYSGCRARTPIAFRACLIRDGIAYRLASGGHFHCSPGIEPVAEAAFLDLAGALDAGP